MSGVCTNPEPRHHLHKGVHEDHTVLQQAQPRDCRRRRVGCAAAQVDEQRERAVRGESETGDGRPDIPIHCQGLSDVLGKLGQNLEVLSGKVTVS